MASRCRLPAPAPPPSQNSLPSTPAARPPQEMALEPKSLPALQLNCLATITGAWATHDPMVLQATDPLHVWGPEFLEARLKWRSKQPITILELRWVGAGSLCGLQAGGGMQRGLSGAPPQLALGPHPASQMH